MEEYNRNIEKRMGMLDKINYEFPLISIIVPVYNAEDYLEKCLNSIIKQTYSNLEIILVDDGSDDRSLSICKDFEKEDSRIKVYHQSNRGQAAARNFGLDICKGEYIAFVDSDDWIELSMFEFLYKQMEDFNAQISVCGIQRDFISGKIMYMNPNYPCEEISKLYSKNEAAEQAIWNMIITYSLCDKLYHRSIFDNIRLTEGSIYEDEEIIPLIIEASDKIVYNCRPLYHYRVTEQSTTRGMFNEKRFIQLEIAKARAEDYKIRYPKLYDDAMAYYYTVLLQIVHACGKSDAYKEKRKKLIKEFKNITRDMCEKMTVNNRIKVRAIRNCPMMFELIMRINDLRRKISGYTM